MNPYINTAITAARRAGDIILRSMNHDKPIDVETKGPNDFVTAFDRAVEQEITRSLLKYYPDHSVLGEEFGHQGNTQGEFTWIIDPIDGTNNFIHGYPHFCISIALKIKDRIEHAMVYDLTRQDIYTASKGSGAQKNNKRIRIDKPKKLSEALIGTALPPKSSENRPTFFKALERVAEESRSIRIAGAAALDLCLVASGQLDGFFATGLAPWDVAAGGLIIKEAGGLVLNYQGQEDYLNSAQIIAAHPKLLKELIACLPKASDQ